MSWHDARRVLWLMLTRGKSRFAVTLLLTRCTGHGRYSVISALAAVPRRAVRSGAVLAVAVDRLHHHDVRADTRRGGRRRSRVHGRLRDAAAAGVIGLATAAWRLFTFYVPVALAALLFPLLARRAERDVMSTVDFDVVVVGTGPGGATVARELARAGRRVLILERGRDWRGHPLYGTYPGALLYADRHALLFTKEGLNIVRPLMVGGATNMYAAARRRRRRGCASATASTSRRTRARWPRRAARRAAAARAARRGVDAVAEAALALGMDWQPQDKFMLPARCAAVRLRRALPAGLPLRREVDRRRVRGRGRRRGRHAVDARARDARARGGRRVPASAGGAAGRRSGARRPRRPRPPAASARRSCCAPPASSGARRRHGHHRHGLRQRRRTRAWARSADDVELRGRRAGCDVLHAHRPLADVPHHHGGEGTGLAADLAALGAHAGRDDQAARRDQRRHRRARPRLEGAHRRRRERLDRAEAVARRILVAAGCARRSLIRTPLRGTHPSATARIGDVVDAASDRDPATLRMRRQRLPRSARRPTVLTIIALARRLAQKIAFTGAGIGLTVIGGVITNRADDALSRAIWHYNRELPR
jgi:hypothetical protein